MRLQRRAPFPGAHPQARFFSVKVSRAFCQNVALQLRKGVQLWDFKGCVFVSFRSFGRPRAGSLRARGPSRCNGADCSTGAPAHASAFFGLTAPARGAGGGPRRGRRCQAVRSARGIGDWDWQLATLAHWQHWSSVAIVEMLPVPMLPVANRTRRGSTTRPNRTSRASAVKAD